MNQMIKAMTEQEKQKLLDQIETLESENDSLKAMMDVEHCPSLETCCKEAKRCEALEEALREASKMLPAYIAGTADINPASEELFYKIEALLTPKT